MDKVSNIITIVNLLYSRKCVSIRSIQDLCGISERTVYRYLNTISKSNVPVYYDELYRGYRLSLKECDHISELDDEEIIIIAAALTMLSYNLEGYYRRKTETLIRKIISRQKFALEELLEAFKEKAEDIYKEKDLNLLLTSMIIQGAILLGKKIKIKLKSADNYGVATIDKLSFAFKEKWRLVEKGDEGKKSVQLSDISHVSYEK